MTRHKVIDVGVHLLATIGFAVGVWLIAGPHRLMDFLGAILVALNGGVLIRDAVCLGIRDAKQ